MYNELDLVQRLSKLSNPNCLNNTGDCYALTIRVSEVHLLISLHKPNSFTSGNDAYILNGVETSVLVTNYDISDSEEFELIKSVGYTNPFQELTDVIFFSKPYVNQRTCDTRIRTEALPGEDGVHSVTVFLNSYDLAPVINSILTSLRLSELLPIVSFYLRNVWVVPELYLKIENIYRDALCNFRTKLLHTFHEVYFEDLSTPVYIPSNCRSTLGRLTTPIELLEHSFTQIHYNTLDLVAQDTNDLRFIEQLIELKLDYTDDSQLDFLYYGIRDIKEVDIKAYENCFRCITTYRLKFIIKS